MYSNVFGTYNLPGEFIFLTKSMKNNVIILHAIVASKFTNLCRKGPQRNSQEAPNTHPKLIKSMSGPLRCPRRCSCDHCMTNMVVQDPKEEPPGSQNDAAEYWKVYATRIPSAFNVKNKFQCRFCQNLISEKR